MSAVPHEPFSQLTTLVGEAASRVTRMDGESGPGRRALEFLTPGQRVCHGCQLVEINTEREQDLDPRSGAEFHEGLQQMCLPDVVMTKLFRLASRLLQQSFRVCREGDVTA